ncbi:MAG: imidazole glycerol phosphate synthase subunit HisH [Planctomycetota bacterium]|nr:imidazole glycerol phosphate synthase subunit HisH [Planctomycetaceae bacterium]MDQ3330913.1 imidazole glycerol phosphate synthase subunit HisH [Planctomycetota bacterium]
MITIVDYGMGNLRSVQKAFERIGAEAVIASDPREVATAERLVLPGVGAFRDAIAELRRKDLVGPVVDHLAAGKPFLGICLGLQLLFEVSDEGGQHEGLGVLRGRVERFPDRAGFKVPHMGWNRLNRSGNCPVFSDTPDDAYFYFVHSYHVVPDDEAVVAARTDYIIPFVSAVARDNLFAVQFHPEKSQRHGLALLKNFAELNTGVSAMS